MHCRHCAASSWRPRSSILLATLFSINIPPLLKNTWSSRFASSASPLHLVLLLFLLLLLPLSSAPHQCLHDPLLVFFPVQHFPYPLSRMSHTEHPAMLAIMSHMSVDCRAYGDPQDALEQATASAIVLPPWLARWAVLAPVARSRSRIQTHLAGHLARSWISRCTFHAGTRVA